MVNGPVLRCGVGTSPANGWLMRRKLLLLGGIGAVATLLLVAVNVAYRIEFNSLSESLDDQVGNQMAGLAEALAASIEPELISGTTGEQFRPEMYLRLRNLTRSYAAANRLVSVSVLDTLWQDPFADQPDSLGSLVFSLLDREGQWALMSGLSWTSPTYRWGDSYYRSAAAPIADTADGRTIAIVRLEADAGYFGALADLRRLAWWVHGSSAILTLLLVGLFAWYTRKTIAWEEQLMHSEKLIGLGRLAATIAHEIKNPLGIIKAAAQRLERVDDAGKKAELLRFIPDEVDRLNRILGGYLRLGSPLVSHPVPFPIEEELPQWMEKSFGQDARTRGRWRMEIEPTGPILASPDTPKQVLINLVNNAFDASPPEQPIDVRWGSAGHKHGRLTVADRGPGVSKKDRKRVFEPFYTTKAMGSGLGLYAVKMMVEQDAGRVCVEDNPGGGAVFVVEWPLAGRGDRENDTKSL